MWTFYWCYLAVMPEDILLAGLRPTIKEEGNRDGPLALSQQPLRSSLVTQFEGVLVRYCEEVINELLFNGASTAKGH